MNIREWIKLSIKSLKDSNVSTPELDAEVILSDYLGKDRSWIHANDDFALSKNDQNTLNDYIERRSTGEPVAYITGKQEFYGRTFKVSPDTLTPRPETETLVSKALDLINKNGIKEIADIGTGSGCIIITLFLEAGNTYSYTASDISDSALEIAIYNASKHNADVSFVNEDLRAKSTHHWDRADLVVANLPYVPSNFNINLAASHEPEFAIFGGHDGLELYRELFSKLTDNNRFIICECLPPQQEELIKVAKKNGYRLINSEDLITVFARSN